MPEMPEVQGLVDFLNGRTTGLEITRVTVASFSALKTYDPPVHALQGAAIAGRQRAAASSSTSTRARTRRRCISCSTSPRRAGCGGTTRFPPR